MKAKTISEADLAARVVAWLEERGWVVYQECRLERIYMAQADIVAVKDQQVWVIEAKARYSLEVISQARAWMQTATYVSIAVPSPRREAAGVRNVHFAAREFCEWKGIGVIEVDFGLETVTQRLFPRSTDIAYSSPWLDAVKPGHRTHARAGTNMGGGYTEFRETSEKLQAFVVLNPGISIKEATRQVSNHYANRQSFASAVRKWAGKAQAMKGIEVREVHGVDCLFPVEQEELAS